MRDIREEFLSDDLKTVEPRGFVKECDRFAFAAKIERRDVNVKLAVSAIRLKPYLGLDAVLKRPAECFVKVKVAQDLADPAAFGRKVRREGEPCGPIPGRDPRIRVGDYHALASGVEYRGEELAVSVLVHSRLFAADELISRTDDGLDCRTAIPKFLP